MEFIIPEELRRSSNEAIQLTKCHKNTITKLDSVAMQFSSGMDIIKAQILNDKCEPRNNE